MAASEHCTEVRTRVVTGDCIAPKSYILSPNDLHPCALNLNIIFPVFYKYQLDGDKLAEALTKLLNKYQILCGRFHPDKDTQLVIKVDPSDKERCSVPFYEIRSSLTIAEAVVKHGRTVMAANGLDFTAFPFFCAKTDTSEKLEGNEPVLKVKLTHFVDGCCLAATLCHGIADGTRYGKLLCDLSKIYREEEIGDVCHDRSYLWPDRLVETFPMLGEEMASAPRKVSEKIADIPAPLLHKQPCQLHSLYVPKEDIEGLKAKVKQIEGEAQTVSSNDILSALCWMLESEITSKRQPIANVKDLDLGDSWSNIIVEVLTNGCKCIPDNYFGNACSILPVVPTLLSSENQEQMSYVEALSKLATAVRQTVVALRNGPELFGKALVSSYVIVSTGQMVIPSDRYRCLASNNVEIKEKDADFGEGKPVLMTYTAAGGTTRNIYLSQTGPDREGRLIHVFLAETQKDFIQRSVILKELVPGAKNIFDFTPTELAEKIV